MGLYLVILFMKTTAGACIINIYRSFNPLDGSLLRELLETNFVLSKEL
jgi:hypothetical protein